MAEPDKVLAQTPPPRVAHERLAAPGRSGRPARRRLLIAIAVVVALVAGCAGRGQAYRPDMTGIPEARAAAVETIDDAAERVVLSDQVTVLGEGRADGCEAETDEAFFAEVTRYFCAMGWMVAFVVPDARTREEVAGAVDAELQAMDVAYSYTLAEDLVMPYPSVRAGEPLTGVGQVGGAQLTVEATPFRASSWRAPRIPRGSAEVSAAGNLDAVTAAAVEATGADEVVTVLVTTMYWDTAGPQAAGEPPAPLRLEHYGEGAVYAFDIALPVPVENGEACAQDGAVDPLTVSSVSTPFPRLTFALTHDATSADMQRVRGCLTAGLSSGAVAVLTPHDPNE